jgi:hypothetical protein
MGPGIRDTPGVLSWDRGLETLQACCHGTRDNRETPGLLSWDQGLETLQECCHGIRDNTHCRIVVMGSGAIYTIGLLSWDQE